MVLISMVLLCNASYAQRSDWNLGFRMGIAMPVLEKIYRPDFKIETASYCLPVGLDMAYNIDDRFSISSGIGFSDYHAFWGTEKAGGTWVNSYEGHIFLRYVQIPLNVKYAIPLGKSNFSVYGKLGFSFDFLVDQYNAYDRESGTILHYEKGSDINIFYYYEGFCEYKYKHTAEIYDKKINVLLNAGIGFGYRFKNGLGLSLEGEYYAGLRTMGHVFIEVAPPATLTDIATNFPIGSEKYSEHLLIKGNYWNFSLGVSYNFKKKEKVR